MLGVLAASTAAAAKARPAVVPADLPSILAAVRKPGARAVLVNVWATWCDPCREEMPDLVRFYRRHKSQGLRLVLISADDVDDKAEVRRFLASQGVDFPSFLRKAGDDMEFINGIEPAWSGALPASFLYDARGDLRHFWSGKVTYAGLTEKLAQLLETKENPEQRRRP